jgi:hypothetical protein
MPFSSGGYAMDWNWISGEFQREWPVIAQTPLSFVIAVLSTNILVGFGIYKLLSEQLKRKNDLITDLERKLTHSVSGVRAIDVPAKNRLEGSCNIKTRPQWEAELPLSEIFKSGNEIHALFLTGEGIFTRHHDYVRHMRRLILPSPDAQYLAMAEVSRKDAGHIIDLGAQIRNYGQVAKQNGVEVRYLSDHVGISFLICNPDKPEAWMHIGFSTPFIDADAQPILRIEKSRSPELYDIFLKSYNKLWEM